MTHSSSLAEPASPLPEAPAGAPRSVTCPLCHSRHRWLSSEALESGSDWACARCGQRWDARRLASVAAYAAWVAAQPGLHEGVSGSP